MTDNTDRETTRFSWTMFLLATTVHKATSALMDLRDTLKKQYPPDEWEWDDEDEEATLDD